VLADIIIRTSLRVVIVSSISRTRHILFIFGPADPFSFEQINNSLNRGIDCSSIIRGESIRATPSGSNIVRLTGMCDGPVIGEGDALACNPFEVCYAILMIFLLLKKGHVRSAAALL
jgi:hypothetical protein